MARLNVQQAATKWRSNLTGAAESIREGVAAVSVAPGEQAVRQQEVMRQNFLASLDDGKWARNTSAVSLSQWKEAMLKKGLPRIGAGAQAGQPNYEKFAQSFYPHLEAGMRLLDSMPRGDLEQNLQRANTMARHNAEYRRNGR